MKSGLVLILVVAVATVVHGKAVISEASRGSTLQYQKCMRFCQREKERCYSRCYKMEDQNKSCVCMEEYEECTGDKRKRTVFTMKYKNAQDCRRFLAFNGLTGAERQLRELGYYF